MGFYNTMQLCSLAVILRESLNALPRVQTKPILPNSQANVTDNVTSHLISHVSLARATFKTSFESMTTAVSMGLLKAALWSLAAVVWGPASSGPVRR